MTSAAAPPCTTRYPRDCMRHGHTSHRLSLTHTRSHTHTVTHTRSHDAHADAEQRVTASLACRLPVKDLISVAFASVIRKSGNASSPGAAAAAAAAAAADGGGMKCSAWSTISCSTGQACVRSLQNHLHEHCVSNSHVIIARNLRAVLESGRTYMSFLLTCTAT